jgi:thioredoxin reductase (NADPH)
MNIKQIYNCVIVGSGPAGYTAAIYTSRANLKPILYTGLMKGGQLMQTTLVENFPGFQKGILGNDLMYNMEQQAKKFNTIIKNECITKIIINFTSNNIHKLYTSKNTSLLTKGLIIATGSSPKYLNIENEKKLLGYGVSTCATCDGFFFKNDIVAIVGGGDTAVEEAIYLSNICKFIYIIVRKSYLKASKILQNNLEKYKNIKIIFNHTVIKIHNQNNQLQSIQIHNIINNKNKTLHIRGLFVAIGSTPNTSILKDTEILDNKGYIITNKNTSTTIIPGIFAAGDVQDPKYKQAIVSAGSGCIAAIELEKYISIKT